MNGETFSAGAQFCPVLFFLSSSGRHATETGCLSVSIHIGSRSGNGRGEAAQPQIEKLVSAKRIAFILKSLPRAKCEAERRDARALIERLGAETEQDLEALIAHRRGREADIVGDAQIARPQAAEVLAERVAERDPGLGVDAEPHGPAIAELRGRRAAAHHPARQEARHQLAAEHLVLRERDRRTRELVDEAERELHLEDALVAGEIDGLAALAAVLVPRAVLVEIEVGVPVRMEVRTAARRGLRIARVKLEVAAAICGRVGLAEPW